MFDVFYILTAFFKILCYSIIGIYLLKQWIRLEKKYASDLPFLMGIAVLFLIPGTIIDIIVMTNSIGPCLLYNFRYSLDLIGSQLIFGAILSVWMSGKVKLRYSIVISTSILFTIIFLLMPTDILLLDITSAMITLPTLLSLIITFMFTYFTKRLTNVHGLLISIATLTVIAASIIRPFLKITAVSPIMPYGLSWITNLILISGWLIMYYGLISKPGYINA
ncbi:MAG: hypothetical protein ACTSQO_09930 [Candidatus Helarchaeota archaeon]